MNGENGEKGANGRAAQSFEELHVYQRARELTNAVYELTRTSEFAADRGLVDQIRRAATSIMSNIAEGFERGSKTEFIQFLFVAKGSCGEVRAQLQIALDQNYITPLIFERLQHLARQTSGMLSNFIAHLQQSDYQEGCPAATAVGRRTAGSPGITSEGSGSEYAPLGMASEPQPIPG
jgi:four helix bundle protein